MGLGFVSKFQLRIYGTSAGVDNKWALLVLINVLQPTLCESSKRPGIAKTSRLYPKAKLAVTKLPLFAPDSITMVASLRPAISLFRFKKFEGSNTAVLQKSVTNPPFFSTPLRYFSCKGG